MDDESKTIATDVNSYEPSLYHFIGQYKAKFALTSLVDQITNDRMARRNPEYPIVLLTGYEGSGRRTLARALHNAVGNLLFKEVGSILGTTEDHASFFENVLEYTTLYIPNVCKISFVVQGVLVQIVRDKCFYKSFPGPQTEIVTVKNRLIILSTDRDTPICFDILKHVDVRCDLLSYSREHIYEIIKQRIAYMGWECSENTIKLISENSENNPYKAIKMLQQCYILARSEYKDKIDITHAKKAMVLSG
jgi:Holliday junction DNA helicase RuvB